jgi:hypothetical protein
MDQQQNSLPVKLKDHLLRSVALCAVIFVLAFTLGSLAGPKVFTVKDPSNLSVANTYEAGWSAARKRLADSDIGPIINVQDMRSVRGVIESIGADRISVRIRPLDPLADPVLDNRVVLVKNTTKIIRLDRKDVKVFQKEMEVFFANIKKGKTSSEPVRPPDPFIKSAISVADLKVGDRIVALASEDIKVAKEFVATEIQAESGRTVSVVSF